VVVALRQMTESDDAGGLARNAYLMAVGCFFKVRACGRLATGLFPAPTRQIACLFDVGDLYDWVGEGKVSLGRASSNVVLDETDRADMARVVR